MERGQYKQMAHPFGELYKPRKKWTQRIDYAVNYLKRYEDDLDTRFTLRYLYYRMTDLSVMPLEPRIYDMFVRVMTRARKDFSNPEYDILREKIIDDTRSFRDEFFYESKFTQKNIKYKLMSALTFKSRIYPFDAWVEIWTEKDTVFKMYEPIAEKYRLQMVSLHGNLSFKTMHEAAIRFKEVEMERDGMSTVILYLGDFNPSGDQRHDAIKTSLRDMGVPVEVYKVLVNKDQIEEYNLQPDVERTTERLLKAMRDPLHDRFVAKHGELYDVNVESMEIETVRELLENAIDDVVDTDKLDEVEENEIVHIPVYVEKVSDTEFIVRMKP